MVNQWSSISLAKRYAVESMGPAVTTATAHAMMALPVGYVKTPVKYAVSTPSVHISVMRLVRRALSNAYGHANIKAPAKCLVQHPVVDYPVTSAARRFCHAATNARVSAARSAPRSTVNNAV
ncbi:hypothetical protein ACJQWK_05048 [Exserohilum turcicum]